MGSARGQGSSRQVKAKDCEVWGMGAIGGSYLTVGDGSKIGACATTVAKKISSWSVSRSFGISWSLPRTAALPSVKAGRCRALDRRRRTFYWNGRTRIKYDVLECSTGSEKKEWCYYQASRPSPINSGVLIYPKK